MPNLDKSGPMGKGPMTGWQRGKCKSDKTVSDNSDSNEKVIYGLGRGGRPNGGGRGWGFGGGRRRGFRRFGGGWGFGRNRFNED